MPQTAGFQKQTICPALCLEEKRLYVRVEAGNRSGQGIEGIAGEVCIFGILVRWGGGLNMHSL